MTGVSLVKAKHKLNFEKHFNITYEDTATNTRLKSMLLGTSQGIIYAPPEDYEPVMR